jgi:hypothetical protein
MASTTIRKYLSEIGSRGGKKSRRTLDTSTAKKMGLLRSARKAYRENHAKCFWSYDPNLKITLSDIHWVGTQILKNGGMKLVTLGKKLCQ